MKKFTKGLLTGVIALGLLAPVITTASNPVSTTVSARRVWHRGTPKHINGWFKQRKGSYQVTVFCYHGLSGAYLMHYYHHHWHVGGMSEDHAKCRYLGYGKYRVVTKHASYTIRKHGSHVAVEFHGHYFGNCHKFTF